jgi:hypothetical protein
MENKTYYFRGYEVSDYAKENGYVDYQTLAKAVGNMILNNEIFFKEDPDEWDLVDSPVKDRYYQLDAQIFDLEEQIEELKHAETKDLDEIENLEDQLEDLKSELEYNDPYSLDIFQWFIVGEDSVDLLIEANQIVYYNYRLNMYLWGITHCGTSWSYVLTDIKL